MISTGGAHVTIYDKRGNFHQTMVAKKGHTGRACTSQETMHGPSLHGPSLHKLRNHARAEKRCTGRETVHGPRNGARAELARVHQILYTLYPATYTD